ncbi:ankyrin repeat-containing protein [Tanacetum coccineum]
MLMDVSPNDNESTNELIMKLLNATMEGSWWKAKAILKDHNAATKVINNNGDTMLHLAVREGKNYFVNQLLNFIKDGSEINTMNSDGHTALHTAVTVDNKQVAELLVNKSNKLLDWLGWLSQLGIHHLLANATSTKQYNLALKLVEIPELLALATKNDRALMALTTNFPHELGFWEALIYPSSDGVRQNIVKRSSLLLYSFEILYIKAHGILWAIRNLKNTPSSCILFDISTDPYRHFCTSLTLIYAVSSPMERFSVCRASNQDIEKKKRDYGEAIEVLKRICNEMNKKATGPGGGGVRNRASLWGLFYFD